jgi:homoserine dehydrogenase
VSRRLTIGLFGFGVVGQGLHDIISSRDLNLEVRKIVIRDASKKRTLPARLFTTDAETVLGDPEIDTIVELINDADAAYHIVKRALASGKNVVSANKRMIANHLEELVELQERHGTSLLYEGSVCGSIPIIRNLEEYYDNELLYAIRGIFNGSSNYILSKIFNEDLDYSSALAQAQNLGFAETDPLLDVGGFDAKYKLTIAAAHAYGTFIHPDNILNLGIQHLSWQDVQYAREKNYRIKLVAEAFKWEDELVVYVLPKFVTRDDFLYTVDNEYNGVIVKAAFADQQFFFGKGAGGHPTGAAVLSDIAALRYTYRYEYKKHHQPAGLVRSEDFKLNVYLRYTGGSLVQRLGFEEIIEQFSTRDFNYITGAISLRQLKAHMNELSAPGTFLVVKGDTTPHDGYHAELHACATIL